MKKDKVKVWKALMVSEEVHRKVFMAAKSKGLTITEFLNKKVK